MYAADDRVFDRPVVVRVEHVELDRAVVGVDRCLHRVAHVVEVGVEAAAVGQVARVQRLRVRVAVGDRVGVDDPQDLLVDDDRIRIGVEAQEGRRRADALLDVALVEDARLVGELAGDEEVPVAEAQRERALAQEARRFDTGRAGVLRLFRLAARGRFLLGDLGADDDISRHVLAEVDAGLLGCRLQLGLHRDLGREVRRLAVVDEVRGRRDHVRSRACTRGGGSSTCDRGCRPRRARAARSSSAVRRRRPCSGPRRRR